jgi:hypothetical protein
MRQQCNARKLTRATDGDKSEKKRCRNKIRGAARMARRPELEIRDQAEINPLVFEVAAV